MHPCFDSLNIFKLCLFVVVVGYAFDKIHEAQTVIWNLVTSKITYNTNHVVTQLRLNLNAIICLNG